MKRLGLFPRVVIAITLGGLLGPVMPEVVLRIFKTFNVLSVSYTHLTLPTKLEVVVGGGGGGL